MNARRPSTLIISIKLLKIVNSNSLQNFLSQTTLFVDWLVLFWFFISLSLFSIIFHVTITQYYVIIHYHCLFIWFLCLSCLSADYYGVIKFYTYLQENQIFGDTPFQRASCNTKIWKWLSRLAIRPVAVWHLCRPAHLQLVITYSWDAQIRPRASTVASLQFRGRIGASNE